MATDETIDIKYYDALDTVLKFATVFIVYRVATYYLIDRDFTTPLFIKSDSLLALSVLFGFVLYFLFISPLIQHNNKISSQLISDMCKFGTVLIVSHVYEQYTTNKNYFNKIWLQNAFYVLLAFAIYRVIIYPMMSNNNDPKYRELKYDVAQYGVFLILLRLLQGGTILDGTWIASITFVLLGFAIYDTVIKKILNLELS